MKTEDKYTLQANWLQRLSTIIVFVSFFVAEKIVEKRRLQNKFHNLSAELTQLQDRHSQLTISMKNQKIQQDGLLDKQQLAEEKISKLLDFIELIKKPIKVSNNSDSS